MISLTEALAAEGKSRTQLRRKRSKAGGQGTNNGALGLNLVKQVNCVLLDFRLTLLIRHRSPILQGFSLCGFSLVTTGPKA